MYERRPLSGKNILLMRRSVDRYRVNRISATVLLTESIDPDQTVPSLLSTVAHCDSFSGYAAVIENSVSFRENPAFRLSICDHLVR